MGTRPAHPTRTCDAGDLLAALLLANIELHPGNLVEAVERSLASTQGILLATVDAAGDAARAKDRTPEVPALP